MLRSTLLALTLALSATVACAGDGIGTITILEGDALVYRGSGRLYALEGLRVDSGDIVETGANTLTQIEMSDGSIVQFGPATRALIGAGVVRGKPERARSIYVLEGWGKVTNANAAPPAAAGFEVRAPLVEIGASPAVVVFQTSSTEAMLFVERGAIRVTERGSAPTPVSLRAGDYYGRKAGARGAVNSADARAVLAKMPRAFRDTLPLRIEKFRDREVKPKEAPAFSYADVGAWLKAEPAIRRQFVQRWRAKSRDAAFRSALIANLSSHPEWDRVLFPEKYLPKPPPAPALTASPTAVQPVTSPPAR